MKTGVFFLILAISSSCFFFVKREDTFAQTRNVDIVAYVEGCGDTLVESGESCDTNNLNGKTCATEGFTTGTLSCTASCTFNTTSCTLAQNTGGGGGGSSNTSVKSGGQVVLTGRAYPRSKITVLKDAQVVLTTIADDNATFQVGVQNLSAGSFLFSVFSEDIKGIRSSLFTFPVSITKNALTKIDNIFIAPTIATDKSTVRKGDPIVIFGQSTPKAEVTLEVNSENQFFTKSLADTVGAYLTTFDSSVLEEGLHHTRSRALHEGAISGQSATVAFTVGSENVYINAQASKCPTKGDFNNDCKVNLVDFSIAAFWTNKPLSSSFMAREKEEVNGDGKINLVDFSIMAFYWTG